MAVTFNELAMEYKSYPYSKEAYDFRRECYEADLMGHYIESQEFLLNNVAELKESYAGIDMAFFMEASDEKVMKAVKEEHDKKSEGIVKKFVNGIGKLWTNFKNFFKRLFSKLSKTNQAIVETTDELKKVINSDFMLTPEEIEELSSIINDCWTARPRGLGYTLSFNSTYDIPAVIDNICDAIPAKHKELSNYIKAAFTMTKIDVKLSDDKKTKKPVLATKVDVIVDMYDDFFSAAKSRTTHTPSGDEVQELNLYLIHVACKRLNEAVKKIEDIRLLSIPVQDKKLERAIDSLDWLEYEKLQYDSSDDRVRIAFTDLNKIYEQMNVILGNTIEMYGFLFKYRSVAHTAIKRFVLKSYNKQNKES